MTRTFILTFEFEKRWKQLEFADEDLRRLELEILRDPKTGAVIRGTGKLRKMRFAHEKDNLSKEECNDIRTLIKKLENSL